MKKIDVHKILLSKKESYGTKNLFKYFIGYNDNGVIIICDNDVITMLCVRLPEMTVYARKFDKNATISFTFNGKQLLKNYNKVWEKVEKLMKIDFENKSVYSDDDKYIKAKIKIYAGSMITNFHNKELLKE